MVGIPKSKGCKTCRARKLKCDEQKPNCDRCLRTGRKCGGYEKQVLWKNSFATTARGSSAASSTSSSSIITISHGATPPREIRKGPSYQLQFISLFLRSYMPYGEDSMIPSSGKMPLIVWPHRLPGLVGRSDVVDSAVNALITSYLGVFRNDIRLTKESMPLYAVAISKVYKATKNLQSGVTEDILSAVMAMTMLEMFMATSTGWMTHVRGGAGLLQQRGPPTADNPINTDLLRRFRSLSISDSIGRRRKSFFESSNWQGLNGPHPYDDLLDIMSAIPSLLEDVDRLSVSTVIPDEIEVIHAINRSLIVERKLDGWYAALQTSVNGISLYWQETAPTDPDPDSELAKLFPYNIRFGAVRLAQLHQLYWAVNVEVYSAIEELLLTHERIRRIAPSSTHHTTTTSTSTSTSRIPYSPSGRSITEIATLGTQYADLCCMVQDYICGPEMGAVGPQSTMGPLGMIKMFYESHDALKLRWCKREFARLSARGFGAAKLLGELSREGYAGIHKIDGGGGVWTQPQPPVEKVGFQQPLDGAVHDANLKQESDRSASLPLRSASADMQHVAAKW